MSKPITSISTLGVALAAVVTFTACGDEGGDGETASASSAGVPTSVTTVPFAPPDGAYSVVFPGGGEPDHQELEAPVPGVGTVPFVLYTAESGDRWYAVSRAEFPAPVGDIASALEGGRDRAIAGVNATLTGSERIELQGRPGIEFTADVTSNGVEGSYVSRIFLDNGKVLYQLLVTGPGDLDESTPDVSAFLDSFEFDDA